MLPRNLIDLLFLGLLWGGSFPMTRAAIGVFGPFALIGLRVGVAALALLPLLAWRRELRGLWQHRAALTVVGLSSVAIPFLLFAWATLHVSSGFVAVVNAMTPLFTALVARLWLGDRLAPTAVLGMAMGLIGVLLLAWHQLDMPGEGGLLPLFACVLATAWYAVGAAVTKRNLGGAGSTVIAAGSQLYAMLFLLPAMLIAWPAQAPGAGAWTCVLALGIFNTALALAIFYALMKRVGPTRAVTVTYIVPLVAILIGVVFLDESVSSAMLLGCAVIVGGTALANGWGGRWFRRRRPAPRPGA